LSSTCNRSPRPISLLRRPRRPAVSRKVYHGLPAPLAPALSLYIKLHRCCSGRVLCRMPGGGKWGKNNDVFFACSC
jgi:hypothetical protein